MKKMGYSAALAAAMIVASFSATAWAADDCGEKPKPPAIPDGSTAKADEMNKAGKEVEAYVNSFDKWHECMANMVNASSEDYNNLVNTYQKEMAAYKAAASTGTKKK